jgi:drug/metabolite transporter (DMT)-like permease
VRSVLALLAAALGLGCVSVAAKLGYQAGARPTELFAARVTLAALLLAPAGLRAAGSIGRRDLSIGAVGGAAFAGAGLAEFQALSRAPATIVVVLLFVAPVWVAIGSWLLWGSAPGGARGSLVVLVLAGTALLVASPDGQAADPAAVALALSASLLSAAFFLSMAQLRAELRALPASCLLAAGAAIWAAPVTAATVPGAFAGGQAAICAVTIGGLTAISLALLCAGLGEVEALTASAIAGAEPLVVAVLSWVVLDEPLGAFQLFGASCVLLGVLGLAGLSRPAPPVEPHGRDEDDADHDVLPEALHSPDQEPVGQHDGDEHPDHCGAHQADAAGQ